MACSSCAKKRAARNRTVQRVYGRKTTDTASRSISARPITKNGSTGTPIRRVSKTNKP